MMKISTLLIDDEPWVAKDLVRVIGEHCPSLEIVAVANTYEDGLVLVKEHDPQVLFCDVKIGRRTGLDFVEELKNAGCKFECVFISAYSDFDYVRDALRLGAQDYLKKPVDVNELRALEKKVIAILRERSASAEDRDGQHRVVREIVAEVRNNGFKQMTLSDFAEKHHFNLSYLSNLFKMQTGVQFSQFLYQERMKRAGELIKSNNKTMYEISTETGYNDYFHFSKQFKRYYGVSPNEYKAGLQKEKEVSD